MALKYVAVHIERLVLRGVRPEDRHAVADGLRRELGRLLAEPGVARRLARLGDVPRLAPGRVHLGSASPARRVGEAAARAIGRAASHEPARAREGQ